MQTQPSKRALFVAGKLTPRRDPRPCTESVHYGEPIDAEKMDAMADRFPDEFNQIWRTIATCGQCRNTVDRSLFRRIA